MYCTNCGHQTEGAFCTKCGAKMPTPEPPAPVAPVVAPAVQATVPPPAPQPAMATQPPIAPAPQPQGTKPSGGRTKLVLGLVAWSLVLVLATVFITLQVAKPSTGRAGAGQLLTGREFAQLMETRYGCYNVGMEDPDYTGYTGRIQINELWTAEGRWWSEFYHFTAANSTEAAALYTALVQDWEEYVRGDSGTPDLWEQKMGNWQVYSYINTYYDEYTVIAQCDNVVLFCPGDTDETFLIESVFAEFGVDITAVPAA